MRPAPADITGWVLAGGQGHRMGGVDKGLLPLPAPPYLPLALHALQRLRSQVATVMISANRHLAQYQSWGVPVWADAPAWAGAGPLAGVHQGLTQCPTPWLLTVPCDAPAFPLDLAERLAHGAALSGAVAAIAWSAGRAHPVFCLVRKTQRDALEAFLAEGGRRFEAWAAQLGAARVDFDPPAYGAQTFINLNTPQDLQDLEPAPGDPPTGTR